MGLRDLIDNIRNRGLEYVMAGTLSAGVMGGIIYKNYKLAVVCAILGVVSGIRAYESNELIAKAKELEELAKKGEGVRRDLSESFNDLFRKIDRATSFTIPNPAPISSHSYRGIEEKIGPQINYSEKK